MQPKWSAVDQGDLFRSRLDQILNHLHSLYWLADSIDWSFFEKEFGPLYTENFGRPGLPIRLRLAYTTSSMPTTSAMRESWSSFWKNPYWQYFYGFQYFQHEFPLDPTTLVKWRKRIGPKGMEKLLQRTVETERAKVR